jgi:hypothetical protein
MNDKQARAIADCYREQVARHWQLMHRHRNLARPLGGLVLIDHVALFHARMADGHQHSLRTLLQVQKEARRKWGR